MSNAHTSESVMLREQTAQQTLDGLYAKAVEFVLTPDEAFNRKLDLIEKATDMSTPQKLDAMKEAEDKHLVDKLFYLGIALIVLGAVTPEGRRLIGSAYKRVA